MEITEEMRRAVYVADCDRLGHQFELTAMHIFQPESGGMRLAEGDEQLPHITCRRCPKVWLVVPVEGWDYDDAERQLYGMLRADVAVAQDIVRKRGRRDERRRARDEPRQT